MTDYEMGQHVKRLKSIVAHTEKKAQSPTTMDLWETRDIRDYHALRRSLDFMEKDGLVRRHPEDRWSWTVTCKGKGYIVAWRME